MRPGVAGVGRTHVRIGSGSAISEYTRQADISRRGL
jgi:hypothetical protein